MTRLCLLTLSIITLLLPFTAAADDCMGTSVTYVDAPDVVRHYELREDGRAGWSLKHLPSSDMRPLALFWDHAHFTVYTPAGEAFFGLLEASAEHRLDDRLLIATPDGKVVAKLASWWRAPTRRWTTTVMCRATSGARGTSELERGCA